MDNKANIIQYAFVATFLAIALLLIGTEYVQAIEAANIGQYASQGD